VEGEEGGEAQGTGSGSWDDVEESGATVGGGGPEEDGEESSGYALGCHG